MPLTYATRPSELGLFPAPPRGFRTGARPSAVSATSSQFPATQAPVGQTPSGPAPPLDYLSLALGDPGYLQTLAFLGAEQQGARSTGQQALIRYLTRLGLVPEGLQPQGLLSDVNLGAVRQTAQLNEFSIIKELQRLFEQQLGRAIDIAGGRGLARSGEIVVAERELGREKKKRTAGAIEDFLDFLSGIESQYAQGLFGGEREKSASFSEALSRVIQLFAPQPSASVPTPFIAPGSAVPPPPSLGFRIPTTGLIPGVGGVPISAPRPTFPYGGGLIRK